MSTGWSPVDAFESLLKTRKLVRNRVACWLETSPAPAPAPAAAGADDADLPTASAAWLGALAYGPGRDLNGLAWPNVSAWLAADGRPSGRTPGAFTEALLLGLGTPDRPGNLPACLQAVSHDPALVRQGFRTAGAVGPDWTVWASRLGPRPARTAELLLQRGHALAAGQVAFTADGTRMITGSEDSTVRVSRLPELTLLKVVPDHMVGVTALALSGDERYLASGDGAGQVRVHDMVGYRPVETGAPLGQRVESLGFLDGGTALAALDGDGGVWVWKADGGSFRRAQWRPAGGPSGSPSPAAPQASRWRRPGPTAA